MSPGRIARLLVLCAGFVSVAGSSGAEEAEKRSRGAVFLSHQHDDFRLGRFASELSWVGPAGPFGAWLQAEIGGRYWQVDGARAGHAVLGGVASLPGGRDHLSLRYEHGEGRVESERIGHRVGAAGWEHAWVKGRVFTGTELRFIRVGDVKENLFKLGLGLVPAKWLLLEGGYFWSILGGEGVETWTARGDLSWRSSVLSLGFTRSEDTIDLSSIGQRKNSGLITDEVRVGWSFPVGRHGLSLSASRYESRFQERYTLGFTLRWALPDSG